MKILDEDVREIYRKIAMGENKHGSFLTHFAEVVIRADAENFSLIRSVAVELIIKYKLGE